MAKLKKAAVGKFLREMLGQYSDGAKRTVELYSVNGSDLTLAKVTVRERKLRHVTQREIWADFDRKANALAPRWNGSEAILPKPLTGIQSATTITA